MADDKKKDSKKGHHEGLHLLLLFAVLIAVVAWMVSQHGAQDNGAKEALGGVRGMEKADASKQRPVTWVDMVENARQGRSTQAQAQQKAQLGGVHR